MGMDVSRWIKYAKARVDSSIQSGNKELDRREADLEAERVDRPWLASEGDAPTFEEAQARIRWKSEAAGKAEAEADQEQPSAPAAADGGDPTVPALADAPTTSPPPDRATSGIDVDALGGATAAEQAAARLELDERARASAERLAEIRRELGVDDPTADGGETPQP